ncbi:MAG: hypothetical protein ACLQA5_25045 [Solirubrobacteraceae bacterium]
MAEGSQDPHPDELYSDLDMLVDASKAADRDVEKVHRMLESLKAKLDKFVHSTRSHSGGDPAG